MLVENIFVYVKNLLNAGKKVDSYFKIVKIKARPAKEGEEIITKMADNHIETKCKVKDNCHMVITNPNGEEYVVSCADFVERYDEAPEGNGFYIPKPIPQKMLIIDEDIQFMAPWGEIMDIKAGGALNITKIDKAYIYGIQPLEFAQTYKKEENNHDLL